MSSGSESDEEYVPGEPEQVSVEESADEETDLQFEKELEHKTKKRKATSTKTTKKKRTRNSCKQTDTDSETEEVNLPVLPLNPEAEKKREDDLWAMFLEGTDTKPKAAAKEESNTNEPVKPTDNNKKTSGQLAKKGIDDSKDRERRIFEFAGETIVVENNVIKEKLNAAESPAATVSKEDGPSRSRVAGGLSGVLGQLNKKSTLSTLEKSKLDWLTYKKEEGIEEEIQSHNKGKAGYLDRKDFLERADVRQYEIERDLRIGRRSNR